MHKRKRMIRIDPNKVRHVTEPGCFGDMSQDYDCITLSYANELVAHANSQIEEFCRAVAEADNEGISEVTPLTKENAAEVVRVFTRMPYSAIENYVNSIFDDTNRVSCHFAQLEGVWQVTSYKKLSECTLVEFIKNFKSEIALNESVRMPLHRFTDYMTRLLNEYKRANNIED